MNIRKAGEKTRRQQFVEWINSAAAMKASLLSLLPVFVAAYAWFDALPARWRFILSLLGVIVSLPIVLGVGLHIRDRLSESGELREAARQAREEEQRLREAARRREEADAQRLAAAKSRLRTLASMIPRVPRNPLDALSMLSAPGIIARSDDDGWKREIRYRLRALVRQEIVDTFEGCLRSTDAESAAYDYLSSLSDSLIPSDLRGSSEGRAT